MNASPTAAQDLFYEGTRRLAAGELAAAEAAFREALRLDPALAEASGNLGLVLDRAGRAAEAEAAYLHALALAPGQGETCTNLGVLWLEQQRLDDAEWALQRALAIHPESPSAWTHYGVLLACRHQDEAAERHHRQALTLSPGYRKARFNLAYLLLRQGRYEEGWQCFEARDWYEQLASLLDAPRWQGEPLAGKSILVGIEAGHGDMIQFCRYARELKARGARRVSVLCHPALKRLFRGLAGADDAIAVGDPAPAGVVWDYWSPPMSFPYFFDTRVDTVPAELPYLHVEPQQVADWAQALGDKGGVLRVGLVWKGNPRFENDSERSLRSLAELAPLGDVAGVRFYSLQKGAGEAEAAASPFPIVDLAPRIADFSDTAAILANLDLLISVDTAVAHLAGALGRPCWLLLPDYKTDWRWLTERTDSPWYPGVMRLFRQGAAGGWTPVVAALRAALMAHPGRKPPG